MELRTLEAQIEAFLSSLRVDSRIEAWVLVELSRDADRQQRDAEARRRALQTAHAETDRQLAELTRLRLRSLIDDQEFIAQRQALQAERLGLQQKLAARRTCHDRFEPVADLVSFSSRAAQWFRVGDDQQKRLILQTAGSNLSLKGKILSIQAAPPFSALAAGRCKTRRLAVVEDYRTFRSGKTSRRRSTVSASDPRIGNRRWLNAMVKKMRAGLEGEQGEEILKNTRTLRAHFEPETLVKPKRPPRALAA